MTPRHERIAYQIHAVASKAGWGMTIYGGFVEGGNFGAVVSTCPEGKPRKQSGCSNDCPARAWLLSIISALISETPDTPKGETP